MHLYTLCSPLSLDLFSLTENVFLQTSIHMSCSGSDNSIQITIFKLLILTILMWNCPIMQVSITSLWGILDNYILNCYGTTVISQDVMWSIDFMLLLAGSPSGDLFKFSKIAVFFTKCTMGIWQGVLPYKCQQFFLLILHKLC